MIKSSITILIVFLSAFSSYAIDKNSGIIFGDNIPVQDTCNFSSNIIKTCNTGLIVKILDAITTRDTTKRKEANLSDENYYFGYFWYYVMLPSGEKGWINGEYVYVMKKYFEGFSKNAIKNKLSNKKIIINNETYFFDIAQEPAYSGIEDGMLVFTATHGLPFLYKKNTSTVIPLWISPTSDFPGEKDQWFRMTLSNIFEEEFVDKVENTFFEKKPALKISITYKTQESGGKYYLIVLPEKEKVLIVDYKELQKPIERQD